MGSPIRCLWFGGVRDACDKTVGECELSLGNGWRFPFAEVHVCRATSPTLHTLKSLRIPTEFTSSFLAWRLKGQAFSQGGTLPLAQ